MFRQGGCRFDAPLTLSTSSTCSAAIFLVFRFLVGMAGSAFLSVAGGTVVDMFNPYYLFAPMVSGMEAVHTSRDPRLKSR